MPDAVDHSPPGFLGVALITARLAVREATRARALRGVLALCLGVLGLFALAAAQGLDAARRSPGSATEDVVGSTLLGTAAFTALLLGAVVAVFLGHGAVRGDAQRGLLQPLMVRPVRRGAVMAGRLLAAATLAGAFTGVLWGGAVVVVGVAGGWVPPSWAEPGFVLMAAVVLVALTAVVLSSFLPALAAGIATLTLVGLGFTVGLLAQLGSALDLDELTRVADVIALVLPFEALYRHVLHVLSAEVGDLSSFGIAAGPFGGARAAAGWHVAWVAGWAVGMAAVGLRRLSRTDL